MTIDEYNRKLAEMQTQMKELVPELTEEKIAELTKLYQRTLDFLERIEKEYPEWNSNIPSACKNCSNHPSNGGSGICHCILGLQEMRW